MIAKYREDPQSATVMILAIILIIGTLAFIFLGPKPQLPTQAQQIDAENEYMVKTADAKQELAASMAYNIANTWPGDPDDIAPAVIVRVTQMARARGLTLNSLRPQRADDKIEPPTLPFLAVLDGPYTSVLQFAKDLEQPGSKLVVTLISVASSDAATDRVTGSIGFVAYLQPATPAAIPAEPTTAQEKENGA